jgi:hypothetical protein
LFVALAPPLEVGDQERLIVAIDVLTAPLEQAVSEVLSVQ